MLFRSTKNWRPDTFAVPVDTLHGTPEQEQSPVVRVALACQPAGQTGHARPWLGSAR